MQRTLKFADWQAMADMPAFILAGGFGTRLRPAFNSGPKAMAPVTGKPFLYYLLRSLRQAGVRRVVLCVGYKHEQIREWAGEGKDVDLDIRYSLETQPLGTGGALALAVGRFGSARTLLAMNGDSLAELDLGEMRRAHLATRASVTVGLVMVRDTARYGRVDIDEMGRVRRLAEKCTDASPGLINCGVYLFETEVVKNIPAGCAVSLERQVLPGLIRRGRVFSFRGEGKFIDIGTAQDFAGAENQMRQVFKLC